MNPYLEQRWGDVHASLVTYTRDILQESLPPQLRARMQERVFIEAAETRSFYPDVLVYERKEVPLSEEVAGGTIALAEPVVIQLEEIEREEGYIEIIDVQSGGRVVTIIEFVSPSNKTQGDGRKLYIRKQREARKAGVNLVEVDLLRGGRAVTLAQPRIVPKNKLTVCHACVWRGSRPVRLEYYPCPLRSRLPTIAIPLRPEDHDVKLDLQDLINLCYRRGRYDDIDYTRPLHPELPPKDAKWVTSLLTSSHSPT